MRGSDPLFTCEVRNGSRNALHTPVCAHRQIEFLRRNFQQLQRPLIELTRCVEQLAVEACIAAPIAIELPPASPNHLRSDIATSGAARRASPG